jgi:hypothetical protein
MNEAVRKPFLPPTPNDAAVEWRRSFIRAATASALAQIQKRPDAGDVLRTNWPDDTRAGIILQRGAVEPTKLSALSGNSVTRLMLLAPQSAAVKLFELAIKIDLSGVSQFSFPLASSFAEATFIEEAMPIPVGDGSFAGMPLGPVRKVALICALSNELERASGDVASIIISHCLEIAIGNGLAKVLFSADPASVIAPAGLLNGATTIAGSADMAQDLGALVGSIAAAGIDTESVVFVAAAEQAMAIKLGAGPLFNYRVISTNLAPGTIIAIATVGLAVAGNGVPVIDVAKHGTLHMSAPASPISAPGVPATIAAPVRSLLQTDAFALRCVARITWAAAPGSISVINGATWGSLAAQREQRDG